MIAFVLWCAWSLLLAQAIAQWPKLDAMERGYAIKTLLLSGLCALALGEFMTTEAT